MNKHGYFGYSKKREIKSMDFQSIFCILQEFGIIFKIRMFQLFHISIELKKIN